MSLQCSTILLLYYFTTTAATTAIAVITVCTVCTVLLEWNVLSDTLLLSISQSYLTLT